MKLIKIICTFILNPTHGILLIIDTNKITVEECHAIGQKERNSVAQWWALTRMQLRKLIPMTATLHQYQQQIMESC